MSKLTIDDVMVRVIRLRNEIGSQKALAERIGISEQYLSDMIRGHRALDTKLLREVGVERVVTYEGEKGWKP